MPMQNSTRPTLLGCVPGAEGKIVVMGFPFDHGSEHCMGSHAAPGVLRVHSNALGLRDGPLWNAAERRPMCEGASISDLGDLRYRLDEPRSAYLHQVREVSAKAAAAGKLPLSLGGDHLITLPLVQGLLGTYPELQVVQIDAHSDYATVRESALPTHATFVAHLLREPGVQRVIQLGVRGVLHTKPVLPERLLQLQVADLEAALLPGVPVYLTIDTDGLDPSLAPAVGYPIPGGLSWADLSRILGVLRRHEAGLVGADWVEYNPEYDTRNNATATAIAMALAHVADTLAGNAGLVQLKKGS
jgi:agmatinase